MFAYSSIANITWAAKNRLIEASQMGGHKRPK